MAEEKRGRGRPPVYTGKVAEKIVALIKEHGLTGTQSVMAEGFQMVPGQKSVKQKISLPTLAKLAKQNGVDLVRGRRKAA